jgi:hypothetical protein
VKDRQTAAVDLQHMATIAERNFQLWWALVNRIYPSYANTLDLYSDFFGPSIDAFQRVYFVELGRLLDIGKDAVNLGSFFNSHTLSDPSIKTDYQNFLKAKVLDIRAIRTIRNKVFAHSDKILSPNQVFANNGITPNKIREIIDELVELVRRIIRDVQTGTGTIGDTHRYEFAAMALVRHIDEWQRVEPKENRRVWTSAPF